MVVIDVIDKSWTAHWIMCVKEKKKQPKGVQRKMEHMYTHTLAHDLVT